jgi:betaine-homocysteine S-methyltransferase
MADAGAIAVGANCEQEPSRMLEIMRAMRGAVDVPLAAQPAAFCTTDTLQAFTKIPEFPDDLETVQVSRSEFYDFAKNARNEGIGYLGGCCGANASYLRAMRQGIDTGA